MQVKHGGCWYCESKDQPVLSARLKKIIAVDGKATEYGVAVCDPCAKAPVLDQRIPVEQRRAA